MRQWTGESNGYGEQILRVTISEEELYIARSDSALLVEVPERDVLKPGYGLYLFSSNTFNRSLMDTFREVPFSFCILPDECSLLPGQFIRIVMCENCATITLQQTDDLPDRTLFFTGQCNSDCVMCPYTTKWRKYAANTTLSDLLRYIDLMNPYAPYVCITGGEPTLLGKDFFILLRRMNAHFHEGQMHILTNGRAFCYPDFCMTYIEAHPRRTLLGIPLYASNPVLHDAITGVPGSFNQTVAGLDWLYQAKESVELRIVLTALNLHNLPDFAMWIYKRYPKIYMVSLMGLEMMGNAYIHREQVWVSYEAITPVLTETVDVLVRNGVQTQIYNLPLCVVNRRHWPLCRKSISEEKVTFPVECEACAMRSACGGFFIPNLHIPGVQVTSMGE